MSSYNRLKKHRQLKRSAVEELCMISSNKSSVVEQIKIENLDSSSDTDLEYNNVRNLTNFSVEYTSRSPDYVTSSHNESPMSYPESLESSNLDGSCSGGSVNQDENDAVTFRDKLQSWAIRFRRNLTIETIYGLLDLLRSENIYDLPKSAAALLKTKSNKNIKTMMSSKNTNGSYVYFGIEENLKEIIIDKYVDDNIRLLFKIDGLPLFNHSNQQFWPILGLILHNEYKSKPFIVSLYHGDSKPKSIVEFLEDFVKEIKILIQNGVTIGYRKFKVDIVGFTCDTPARSFLKQCRGHGGFYACERCETRGVTKNKKRVYTSVNSKRRSKRSFIKQSQAEHHLEEISPLLDIPHFDPINSVFLDYAFVISRSYEMDIE